MSQENDRQLPDGWQWVKLGDVCKIVNGSTPSSTIEEYWNGDIIWITPTDLGKLSSSLITDAARKITKSGYQSCNTEIVPTNSVIISSRAPIGYIGIANIPLCTNQGCKSLVVTEKIDTWFLYFWLKLSIPVLKSIGKGTTFQEISKSQLTIFEIPLPPLSEQKRIAAILNEQMEAVEKARKATEAQLEAAKALPAAYLRAVFESEEANSWERRKLGDVADLKNGINFTSNQKGSGILTVDVLNMYPNGIYLEVNDLYRVDIKSNNEYMLQTNDILFVRSSVKEEGVAWTTLFSGHTEPVTFCGFIIRARFLNPEISPEYFVYYCRSEAIRNFLVNKSTRGTITNINQESLKTLKIPLPPLSEQKRIAAILNEQMEAVEKARKATEAQLEAINKLPAVLLRRAFKGEL